MRVTLFKNSIVFALFIFLLNCTSLRPVELEPEYTFTSPDTPLWQEVAAIKPGNWQVPLNIGPEALDWRLRAIDSATDSIDLQTFLWSFDTVGALILNHLVAAAERGVIIKLLVDDSFTTGEEKAFLELQEHENIEYRIFNPFVRRSNNVITRQILNLAEFHRLDHRMHNKAMVIDNRVAIVGGRNLADEYFGLHSDTNFRDMELLVGGPIVDEISTAFDTYWNNRWTVPIRQVSHIEHVEADLNAARIVRDSSLHIHVEENEELRMTRWREMVAGAYTGEVRLLVDDPPVENPALPESAPVQVAQDLAELFDNALDEILIISAYLIPTPHLEGAIERAIARGVTVRILTNSIRSNNHLTAHSAYRSHINQLMTTGAQIHEVRIDAKERQRYILPPIDSKALALHAKAVVIDQDTVFIGSLNLDPRSLRLNTEMGLVVTSESLNSQIRNDVTPDFSLLNAWELQFNEREQIVWVSDDEVRNSQPASSFMQNLEDWFFAHLPIENEL